MEGYPDPPRGWLKLQARMSRAKTVNEINSILEEMTQVLEKYEAKLSSDPRSQTPASFPHDRKARTQKRP